MKGETVYDTGKSKPDGSTTILDNAEISSVGGSNTSECTEDICYEKGTTILDTYRVESDAIVSGGMGRVWRVHHTGWNVDLAMKRPRAEFFSGEKSKLDFINECDTWIKLGLHSNIVSCYYVRLIDDIPTIFSEWMDGGDLAHTINSGSLYEDFRENSAQVQKRILDIAIQFARGLHYAHESRDESGKPQNLIHRDVKPGNVLLSKSGEVKVSDFGLTKSVTQPPQGTPAGGAEASCFKGTLAYCSIEQMDEKPLTQRTDLYSWAVSVMELYVGSHPWTNGVVAGLNCQKYLSEAQIPIPAPMEDLLERCLASDPDDRPHDFGLVIAELRAIYRMETGEDYPREASKAAADTADSLNNRALSMLDLGKPEEAEKLWEKALEVDCNNTNALYNQGLASWRAGKLTDLEARKPISDLLTIKRTSDSLDAYAELFIEQSNYVEAAPLLEEALLLVSGNAEIQRRYLLATEKMLPTFQFESKNMLRARLSLSPNGQYLVVKNQTNNSSTAYEMNGNQVANWVPLVPPPEQSAWLETPKLKLQFYNTSIKYVTRKEFNHAYQDNTITLIPRNPITGESGVPRSYKSSSIPQYPSTKMPSWVPIFNVLDASKVSKDGKYAIASRKDDKSKLLQDKLPENWLVDTVNWRFIRQFDQIAGSRVADIHILNNDVLRILCESSDSIPSVRVYDLQLQTLCGNAHYRVSRIFSTVEITQKKEALQALLTEVELLYRRNCIVEALVKIEEARKQPDYLANADFCRINNLFAESCERVSLRNHRIERKMFTLETECYAMPSLPLIGSDNSAVVFMDESRSFYRYVFQDGSLTTLLNRKKEKEYFAALSPDGKFAILPSYDKNHNSINILQTIDGHLVREFSVDHPALAASINALGDVALLFHGESKFWTSMFLNNGCRVDVNDIGVYSKMKNPLMYGICLSKSGNAVYTSLRRRFSMSVRGLPISADQQIASSFHLPDNGIEKKRTIYPALMLADFGKNETVLLSGSRMYATRGNVIAEFPVQKVCAQCICSENDHAFFIDEEHTLFMFSLPEDTGETLIKPSICYKADIGGQSQKYSNLCITPDGSMLIAKEETLCNKLRFALIKLDWEYQYRIHVSID